MSRYIDAEKAIAHFNLMYDEQEDKDDPYNVGVMGAINYIKHRSPSIDIVFCKECTERDDDWCMYFGNMINPDDFCSYGEREGE